MSKSTTLYARACKLLGVDPAKVRLIGPTEWKELHGYTVSTDLGLASKEHAVVYVRRTAGYDTYVHELLHILFPSRPHWWIFEAAWKLTGITKEKRYGYGQGYTAKTGAHQVESKAQLLRLARAAAVKRGCAP